MVLGRTIGGVSDTNDVPRAVPRSALVTLGAFVIGPVILYLAPHVILHFGTPPPQYPVPIAPGVPRGGAPVAGVTLDVELDGARDVRSVHAGTTSTSGLAVTSPPSVAPTGTPPEQSDPLDTSTEPVSSSPYTYPPDEPYRYELTRGDINGDGVEDVVFDEIYIGASATVHLTAEISQPDGTMRLLDRAPDQTAFPDYMTSSYFKTQVSNVTIDDGEVRVTAYGWLYPEEAHDGVGSPKREQEETRVFRLEGNRMVRVR